MGPTPVSLLPMLNIVSRFVSASDIYQKKKNSKHTKRKYNKSHKEGGSEGEDRNHTPKKSDHRRKIRTIFLNLRKLKGIKSLIIVKILVFAKVRKSENKTKQNKTTI